MRIMQKDTITSLELLEQINAFRKIESEKYPDNRLFVEIKHDSLLKIIRDEFDEEISLGELNESSYKNSRGKIYPMFVLTHSQAKQVLLRENKIVRRGVIKYIEKLEETIKLLQERKLDKKQQVEAMKKFGSLLPEIESKESLPYVKINTCVNKATSNYFGFPKMLKKDEMSQDMLLKRSEIMDRFLIAYELFKDITKAKEFIYVEFAQPTIELKNYDTEMVD